MSKKPSGGSFIEWARAYDELGWIVLPLGRRSKVPAMLAWQELEDNNHIEEWWERDPDRNVGIVAGECSDILVLDVDYKTETNEGGEEVVLVDGEKTLSELERIHGKLPETVEQVTGSGTGRHLVFKFRPGLRNKGRRRGGDDDGLDVRTSRGQIVVEPSVHPVTGTRYRWRDGHSPWDLEPAEMPDWLYDVLPKNQEEKYESQHLSYGEIAGDATSRVEAYIDNAVNAEIEAVRETGEGGRNDRLNEAAYKIAGLWHHGTFSEDDVRGCLLDAARDAGLKQGESLRTIASGWRKGLTKPRALPAELYEEPDWIIEEDDHPKIKISLPLLMVSDAEVVEPVSVEEIEDDIEKERGSYESDYAVPRGTFEIPGMLGELCAWIDMCAVRPAPLLTLGCALATLGVLFGRKYASPTDIRTNLYVVGVAGTTGGKDNARKRAKSLLNAAGTRLVCGRIRSDAGLEEALALHKKLLLFIDEMGDVLGSMEGKGAASWEARVKPMLKELYSSSDSSYEGAMVVTRDEITIDQPHLGIYGTSTHKQFWQAISSSNIEDGFLNRLLVLELPPEKVRKRKINRALTKPPYGLVEWVKRVSKHKAIDPSVTGNLSNSEGVDKKDVATVPIQLVPYTRGAESLFDEWDEESDDHDEGLQPFIWGRAHVTAQKLAIIRAIGCNFEDPRVVEADAQWAINLTRWAMERLEKSVLSHVSENKVEGQAKRVLQIIAEAGPSGISKTDLTRRTKWLKPNERDDLLKTLFESGEAVQVNVKTSGRKRVMYRATEPGRA